MGRSKKLNDFAIDFYRRYNIPISTIKRWVRKIVNDEDDLKLVVVYEGKVGRPPLYIVKTETDVLKGFLKNGGLIMQTKF
jgi:hypothetical protein